MKKGQVQIESVFMSLVALLTFALTVIILFRNTNSMNVLLSFTQGELLASTLVNRLISSADCLAYERTDFYFNSTGDISELKRVYPGVLDFEKFKNWDNPNIDYEESFNNFQCLSYFVTRPGVLFPSGEVIDYRANLVFNVTIFDAENLNTYTLKSGSCLAESCLPYTINLPVKIHMPDGSFHYGIMSTIVEFGWDKPLIEEN
jgi:hypothetical protein